MRIGILYELEILDAELGDFWKEVPEDSYCSINRTDLQNVSKVDGHVPNLTPAQAEAFIQLVARYHIYKTPD